MNDQPVTDRLDIIEQRLRNVEILLEEAASLYAVERLSERISTLESRVHYLASENDLRDVQYDITTLKRELDSLRRGLR